MMTTVENYVNTKSKVNIPDQWITKQEREKVDINLIKRN